MDSGAGSTIFKFGLLIILINCLLKAYVGIGLWKMALEFKNSSGVISSLKYDEEQIGGGDPTVLTGQN